MGVDGHGEVGKVGWVRASGEFRLRDKRVWLLSLSLSLLNSGISM